LLGEIFQVQPVAFSAICCLLDGILKEIGGKLENENLARDSFFSPTIGHYLTYF